MFIINTLPQKQAAATPQPDLELIADELEINSSIMLDETSLIVVFKRVPPEVAQQLVRIDMNVEHVKGSKEYQFRDEYAARLLEALLTHLGINKQKDVEEKLAKWSEMQRR